MFRTIRLALLLGLLAFVAAGAYLSRARSTDWDAALWVAIHPINADGSEVTTDYVEQLSNESFAAIETFMAREAEHYELPLTEPVRVELYDEVPEAPPLLDRDGGFLSRAFWSLKLRHWAWRTGSDGAHPPPDIRMFVLYHDPASTNSVPHSLGLQKGLVGVVYAFAGAEMTAPNNIVIAHEFLHTLGASDKYEPGDDRPSYPDGFADPEQEPLYPQERTEVMAGRRMVSEQLWEMPASLRDVVIGEKTATEINWISAR
jgi:hypothetical protein